MKGKQQAMSKYTSHYLTNRSSGTARNHKSRNDRPPTYHWVDNRPEAIDAKASQTLDDNSARMQDLMAMLSFSVFDWKYPFWENLVRKVKIITLT